MANLFKNKESKENRFSEALEKESLKNNQEQSLKKVDIKKYKDLEGVTLEKLNIGLWYIEHKMLLKNILIGFMIAISAALWSYSIYGFAYYIAKGMVDDKLMADEMTKKNIIGHQYLESLLPVNLAVGKVEIFKSSGDRYDFAVQITNPNTRYGAEFEYYFSAGDEKANTYKNFILPGETKYLLSLSNEFNGAPGGVSFGFSSFSWRKINRHLISDWNSYVAERSRIAIKDVVFTPASISGLSKEDSFNILEFTALNDTAYSYWDVDFNILLQGVGGLTAVSKYNFNEFMSGENRHASLSWPGTVGRVNKVDVIPEINFFDDDIYIEPKGGIGEIK